MQCMIPCLSVYCTFLLQDKCRRLPEALDHIGSLPELKKCLTAQELALSCSVTALRRLTYLYAHHVNLSLQ